MLHNAEIQVLFKLVLPEEMKFKKEGEFREDCKLAEFEIIALKRKEEKN